jgi:DNA-binding NarL/FixJ family response regulator
MKRREALGLLLTDDMIFSSRITGTAQALGLKVNAVKSVEDLTVHARDRSPTCIIIDLSHPGLQVPELIRELKNGCSPMPRLVAYGSHVDAATLRAAREAGCDVVLPRSQFVEKLPNELASWMASKST